MAHAGASADVFHAIADDTRRYLLDRLRSGELAVSELGESLPISQPALSQHLRVLRTVGLVKERRQGRQRLYRLKPSGLRDVADWVDAYRHFWSDRLARLGSVLDEMAPTKRPKARR